MNVHLTCEESINYVKIKYADKLRAVYKLLGAGVAVICMFSIMLFTLFIKCKDAKSILYLFLSLLMIIPFWVIIHGGNEIIQIVTKHSQDYEEGIVLLKQANLKRIMKENDKNLKFCFTDKTGGNITYRVLTCFRYKYSEDLEEDEILVDCRKCIVYISGLHMLGGTF